MVDRRLRSIFRKGSRTYYGATRFFPKDVRDDVFVLYAFVRIADEFVDARPQDPEGFAAFRENYARALTGTPSGDLVIDGFVELVHRTSINPAWVESFLDVMQSDLHWSEKRTRQNLLEYMYGSAEVVGLMMARVLQLPPESYEQASLLGRAMQYINFIRDIAEDKARGRVYFPTEELESFGISQLSFQEARKNPEAFSRFMAAQIEQYHAWQEEAEQGFAHLPPAARAAIGTASDMYAWTLHVIERDPLVVFRRQVRPSRLRVFITGLRRTWRERDSIGKALLLATRPRFWLYLAGTYLVGVVYGAEDLRALSDPSIWAQLAFFLVPANFLLYAVNDLADRDTDAFNAKKDGTKEARATQSRYRQLLWVGSILSLLLGILLTCEQSNSISQWYFGLFLVLALTYSLPPVRLKAKPIVDSASNILYALPGFLGYAQLSGEGIPWLAIAFAWCWTAAMHLFSAIPDIVPDKAAGLRTTAVVLGRTKALIACTLLWGGFATLALWAPIPWPFKIAAWAYAVIPLLFLRRSNEALERVYWLFPWMNGVAGFLLFVAGLARFL
ncbi:MAG: prenyltransferase [Candidatus Doudnabacteria bacterium]|nr:prenyltransferase [Candidatus Doudnabacteria bacterium]